MHQKMIHKRTHVVKTVIKLKYNGSNNDWPMYRRDLFNEKWNIARFYVYYLKCCYGFLIRTHPSQNSTIQFLQGN